MHYLLSIIAISSSYSPVFRTISQNTPFFATSRAGESFLLVPS